MRPCNGSHRAVRPLLRSLLFRVPQRRCLRCHPAGKAGLQRQAGQERAPHKGPLLLQPWLHHSLRHTDEALRVPASGLLQPRVCARRLEGPSLPGVRVSQVARVRIFVRNFCPSLNKSVPIMSAPENKSNNKKRKTAGAPASSPLANPTWNLNCFRLILQFLTFGECGMGRLVNSTWHREIQTNIWPADKIREYCFNVACNALIDLDHELFTTGFKFPGVVVRMPRVGGFYSHQYGTCGQLLPCIAFPSIRVPLFQSVSTVGGCGPSFALSAFAHSSLFQNVWPSLNWPWLARHRPSAHAGSRSRVHGTTPSMAPFVIWISWPGSGRGCRDGTVLSTKRSSRATNHQR